MNEKLMNFVEWLPNNVDDFAGLTVEETVSKINNLSTSEEGKETLKQLIKQYKNMDLFKDGGKLQHLLCLKSGGKGPDCGCKKTVKHQTGGTAKYRHSTWYEDMPGNPSIGQTEKIEYPNGTTRGRTIVTKPDGNGGFQRDTTAHANGHEYVSPHSPDAIAYPTTSKDAWKDFNDLMDGYRRQEKTINVTKHQEGNVLPTEKKRRRVDADGYAWTLKNGTQVLTKDAFGEQTIADSDYEMPGSQEMETRRTAITDRGGNILGWDYHVYKNKPYDISPTFRYTTKKRWWKPRYKELDAPTAARFNNAFRANFKTK